MKFIAGYFPTVLGGNKAPTAEDIKHILGSVGAETDDDKIELLLSQVEGKDITELIASGREKLASVPSGGGAVAADLNGRCGSQSLLCKTLSTPQPFSQPISVSPSLI
ncbi:hypothetical protein GIB67_033862 [Kingdonia uniflora]|uniref:60S acidic ribosomal protein P2 n=1 Tax=Kingdonia uniflora TaxID=39325 RepID=A0A7J7MIW4_9MAGN|nr:hypothetical protein GIB67_033862 [Kingdonia uniflora]